MCATPVPAGRATTWPGAQRVLLGALEARSLAAEDQGALAGEDDEELLLGGVAMRRHGELALGDAEMAHAHPDGAGGVRELALVALDVAVRLLLLGNVLEGDDVRRPRRGVGDPERPGALLALPGMTALAGLGPGGREPDHLRPREVPGLDVEVGAEGERGDALVAGDQGVRLGAGAVHQRVAGAHLVGALVHPAQTRALEDVEDLLLGAVPVHGRGAAVGLDAHAVEADAHRAGGGAEGLPVAAHLADLELVRGDVVPVNEGRHAQELARSAVVSAPVRLATFIAPGSDDARAGEVRGEEVVAFADGSTVLDRLASGDRAPADGDAFALADVTLLAPVPRPRAIFGIGMNYRAHVEEMGRDLPPAPVVFMKLPYLGRAPGRAGALPRGRQAPGLRGRARRRHGRRRPGGGLRRRRRRHRARPPGPRAAVDPREGRRHVLPVRPVDHHRRTRCPTPRGSTLRTWVNGELRQDASTSDLVFGIDELVAFIAETITLEPGDLILTGTPSGVGMAMDPPRFLASGDVIRIEIERLGAIEHAVA